MACVRGVIIVLSAWMVDNVCRVAGILDMRGGRWRVMQSSQVAGNWVTQSTKPGRLGREVEVIKNVIATAPGINMLAWFTLSVGRHSLLLAREFSPTSTCLLTRVSRDLDSQSVHKLWSGTVSIRICGQSNVMCRLLLCKYSKYVTGQECGAFVRGSPHIIEQTLLLSHFWGALFEDFNWDVRQVSATNTKALAWWDFALHVNLARCWAVSTDLALWQLRERQEESACAIPTVGLLWGALPPQQKCCDPLHLESSESDDAIVFRFCNVNPWGGNVRVLSAEWA